MARSAHAYVRGNTLQFYEWLGSIAEGLLPSGPPIWICGDCHVGNLGPVANAEGEVEIEIRDFDQTVIGNPAHDLIRLGLSLAMAARGSNLPGVTTARMMEFLTQGYVDAFSTTRKQPPFERPEVITSALKESKQRTWRHLANERVASSTAKVPLGKRFWAVSKPERAAVMDLVGSAEIQSLISQLGHRDDDAPVEFLDVAYWIKGCSSLGRLRYAALLDVGRSAAKGRDFCLLDIKEAVKAVAPRLFQCRHAERQRRARAGRRAASFAVSGKQDGGTKAAQTLRFRARTSAAGPETGHYKARPCPSHAVRLLPGASRGTLSRKANG